MRGTHKNKRIMMIMSLQNTTAVIWAISSNYKVFWKLIKSTYLITHFSWAGKLRVNMPFWSTSDMSFLCFILPSFCCNLRHLVLTGYLYKLPELQNTFIQRPKKDSQTTQNYPIEYLPSQLFAKTLGWFDKFLDNQYSLTGNLFENILLDYARLQIKLKNEAAVEYYCQLAGGRGKKLWEDHNSSKTTTSSS